MIVNISFDGVDLQDTNLITSLIQHEQLAERNISRFKLARRHGVVITHINYGSKSIPFRSRLEGTTQADLESRIDTLKLNVQGQSKNLDIDYRGAIRRYVATLKSLTITRREGETTMVGIEGEFEAVEGFGTDTSATSLFSETINYKNSTTNLITNPSFETNQNLWSAYNAPTLTRVTTDFYSGAYSLQIITDAVGNTQQGINSTSIAVTNNQEYTFSYWVKGLSGQTVRAYKSNVGGADSFTAYTLTGNWQRVSHTFTSDSANLILYAMMTSANGTAKTFYIDAIQLETGALSTYFDGSLADTSVEDYSWTGTAHASTSARTSTGHLIINTYDGTAPEQLPILTYTLNSFTGAGYDTVSFRNTTTNTKLQITRNWVAGDVLVIDGFKQTAKINGTEVDATGTFPYFTPGSGTLEVTDTFTARNFNLAGNYTKRWL